MDKIKASQFANLAYYCKEPPVPPEYQQVEYIQSDSNSYIKTGFIPSQRFKTIVDGAIISDGNILGCWNGTNGGAQQVSYGISKANGVFRFLNPVQNFSTYNSTTIKSPADTGRHIFVEDWITPQYKVDNNVVTPNNYFPDWNTAQLYLFARNQNGSILNSGTMRAYSVQIYNSANVLVLNLLPCYRKSDHKTGMYDTVSKTMFTNAAGYDFVVGGDV